jgi:hypothetical protein
MLQRLRKFASLLCFMVGVALIVLSIRSYYWRDVQHGRVADRQAFAICSMQGRMTLYAYETHNIILPWELRSYAVDKRDVLRAIESTQQNSLGFGFVRSSAGLIVSVPYWLFVLITGAMFAILRIKRQWRFRLRTLLVATTFVAIVLGMIVKLNR